MRPSIKNLVRGGLLTLAFAATPALAAPCVGVTFGAGYAGSYSCNSLGTPTGVGTSLGGITFLNPNTILIGGFANAIGGNINRIGVTRDAGNHIIGYSGPPSVFASAPFIDGGLSFGPSGTLFATTYSNNTLLQFLPGSTAPDRIISLDALGIASSTGTLAFVPTGFAGAGSLKIASYSANTFYDVPLIADPMTAGLFTLGTATLTASGINGPEGIAYIAGSNPGFGADSVLLSEYKGGSVGAFQIDANGNPIVATRTSFINGLTGAEGAVIDPLTGDFLFSTFGGGNQILVVSGFAAPTAVPEPATWTMMIGGMGFVGGAMRRRRRTGPLGLAA